jgi:hypothetical protein
VRFLISIDRGGAARHHTPAACAPDACCEAPFHMSSWAQCKDLGRARAGQPVEPSLRSGVGVWTRWLLPVVSVGPGGGEAVGRAAGPAPYLSGLT